MFLVLVGRVSLAGSEQTESCNVIERDLIGESSIVSPRPHTLTAKEQADVRTAVINREALLRLLRRRRDIAAVLYRNLARSLAEKLRRSRSDWDLY